MTTSSNFQYRKNRHHRCPGSGVPLGTVMSDQCSARMSTLYLKRKGLVCGTRRWSLVTYGKYDESDNRTYSIELEV